MRGIFHDFRHAVRGLGKMPGFTVAVVLTLALGIGANTAIFSVVNNLLLRTLPVVEPERLVTVSTDSATSRGNTAAWTYGIWDEIRRRAPQMFAGAVTWGDERLNLSQTGGEVEAVDGLYVSGEFFTTLGVAAVVGRTFTSADDVRGGGPDGPVAVISYGMWQRRFGGTADVIGTSLLIERIPFTIIGVTPPAFFGVEVGRTFDVAVPINTQQLIRGKDSAIDGPFYWLWVMLRMKPGQSLDAAASLLRSVQLQIREGAMPSTLSPQSQERFLKEPFMLVPASLGTSRLRQRYERPLLAILVVVALVLLIVCANIANLLLARATSRRQEWSVRLALGATRWRLARLLLVESLVLAGIGALAGLVFAWWASPLLVAQLSTSVTHVVLNLSLDWRVLAFTVAATAATAVLFGTGPAFTASRYAPIDALKEQGRGTSGDARVTLSSGLVVAQVVLSMLLIVAAGLFVGTFQRLATVPLGFDTDRVLNVDVDVTRAAVTPPNRIRFYQELVNAVAAVPGVAHAAGSMVVPVGSGGIIGEIEMPDAPPSQPEPGPVPFWNSRSTFVNLITPGWLATYGTPLLAGRDIDERDAENASRAALVNEAYARKFLSGHAALGETVTFNMGKVFPPRTIVGVVRDAAYVSTRDGMRPIVYVPLAQQDFGPPTTNIIISVRPSMGLPTALAPSVAAALMAADRNLSFTMRSVQDRVDASLAQERLVALLSGFFGALALLLAGLGLYGVTSYAVNRRRGEIGIRMALGAAPDRVIRIVLRRVAVLVLAGVVVGTLVSWWMARFVAPALLYGVEPRDPVTMISAAVVLIAVGLVAGWLPARRASRIDPAQVLRET